MKAPYTSAPGEWGTLAREWRRSLGADNKSPNTVRIYLHAVRQLGDWASSQPTPVEPATIKAQDIRDYMQHLLDRGRAGNAHNHYRSLRTFFTWLVDEEELDRSPMERTRAPQVPEKQVPIVTIEQMSAAGSPARGGSRRSSRPGSLKPTPTSNRPH
ncbi:tyrosine-type recombinase/integrase [Saccharopolyspora hattusasensis]|uniref:tyrosine-type recombinase/integrase n=1 Tax=Saccharopolyspora hattusasensis TaxID=1128679 RepID=UPI003D97BEB8